MRHDPIKSTVRTLEILELFNEARTPLTLTHIYTTLRYPQSSTTLLLKSMVMTGYLKYDLRNRTYFPTNRVVALGDWINNRLYSPGILDLVQRVFEETNEVVTLSVQNDIFVQHLRYLKPAEYETTAIENVLRVLPKSAAGLVLMRDMTPAAVEKLLRHVHIYERTTMDLDLLLAHLAWIRREGYCLLAANPYAFASAIAMPLPQDPHGAPMALGVGGMNRRIVARKSQILDIMRDAITAYSETLQSGQAQSDEAVGTVER